MKVCLQRHKGRAELTFMVEQYLDGPEVDVDVVLNSEGDVAYGNVTDNWPTIEPYFNETGVTITYWQYSALVSAWISGLSCSSGACLATCLALASYAGAPELVHLSRHWPVLQGPTARASCPCTSRGNCASSAWQPSNAWVSLWGSSMWSASTHPKMAHSSLR